MKSVFVLILGIVFQASLQFEAVSVRTNRNGGIGNMIQMPPTGRVNIVNATLRILITRSFGVQEYQLIGGPEWMSSDRFDIQTSPPADYQPEQSVPCIGMNCPPSRVQIMMQRALADRFQLRSHRETRELPVYELAITRNGHKLKEVPPPAVPQGGVLHFGNGISGSAVQFSTIVSTLNQLLDRPVVDKTGIKGYYDFKMVFSREGLRNNVGGTPLRFELGGVPGVEAGANDAAPSIFTAVQESLGLRLDSARGPVEVLVIDSVQKPTEN